ncbi:hypothetical protein [Allomesorhizobium alhagi]|nr:hypothetical protein [Mesorhizobium alhagi]
MITNDVACAIPGIREFCEAISNSRREAPAQCGPAGVPAYLYDSDKNFSQLRNGMLRGGFTAHVKGHLTMATASLLMRAMQLAESGQHIDCLTVESALAVEGYAEAFEVFKDDRLRAGIRTMCQKHWRPTQEAEANDNRSSLEGAQAAQSPNTAPC